MAKMTDAELLRTLKALGRECIGVNGTLQAHRANAIARYLGEPRGDEMEGRSQVVSTVVRDNVEWIVPQWLRVAMGTEKLVEFDPIGPGDEEAAEVETAYVSHQILNKNDALTILSTWARDALLCNNGYVKAWFHSKSDVQVESYKGLPEDAWLMITQDPDVQVDEVSEYEQTVAPGVVATLYDCRVSRKRDVGFVRIENVPHEEIWVHSSVRTLDLQEALYVKHVTKRTESEIRLMGFEVPKLVNPDHEEGDESTLEEVRDRFGDDEEDDEVETYELVDEYVRVDYDGDGIAELRRVVRIENVILANEPTDLIPIACMTPIVYPHRHIGLSYYDLLRQHDDVKTAMMRSGLDNLYQSNNGRWAVDVDRIAMDDMLVSRPGGVVRTRGAPSEVVLPMTAANTFPAALTGLQWVDAWTENSSGVAAYYQGLNKDSLNQTASGTDQIMTASQMRVEAVIRSFANGFRDLCLIVHALVLKNATAPDRFRLQDRWVTVDPREWVKRSAMTVAVGLGGTASRQARIGQLGMLWQMQQSALPMGIARPENLYETGRRLTEELGYRNYTAFWSDPKTTPPMNQPPPPHILDAQTKTQLKQMELQADAQKFQAQSLLELKKITVESEARLAEINAQLSTQAANDERDATREALRAEMDAVVRQRDMALQQWKAEMDAAVAKYQADLNAQVKLALADKAAAPPVDVQPLMETMARLEQSIMAPAEVIRDPATGKALGIKRGAVVQQIKRGPDGRVAGVQ